MTVIIDLAIIVAAISVATAAWKLISFLLSINTWKTKTDIFMRLAAQKLGIDPNLLES